MKDVPSLVGRLCKVLSAALKHGSHSQFVGKFTDLMLFLSFSQIKKPIIERRRRERINDSLNQLKSLLMEAMDKDVSISCV